MASVTKVLKHEKRQKRKIPGETISPEIFDCKNDDHLDRLPGLKKVEVSPLAQKFVGCQVGENITTDTSWVFVDKDKFEDHLEFYEEHSDFFPIMPEIKEMPAKKILVGTHDFSQDTGIDFYFCLTLEVQQIIQEAVAQDKKNLNEKIMNSFFPKSRQWKSLGSEFQVDSGLRKNLRPLIMVVLEGSVPFQKQKVQFVLQNAENIRNGYIELVATRTSMNIILRKRLDRGIQSSPLKKDTGIQAMGPSQSNKSIQYSIEFTTVTLTNNLLTQLHEFLVNKLQEIGDVLKLNFSLDLYFDDYKYLGNAYPNQMMAESTEVKSYQDVINCRRRMISSFTWNAIISGVVAAAHAAIPIFCIENTKPKLDIVIDTVFTKHLVLLWHCSNNVEPKLYLHAARDVTALSFCPYDANILVAGYSNGQIAVWDLRNKLDTDETREFLTDIQQNNHLMITTQTAWFKPPLDGNHVQPVLCCKMDDGHCSTVTTIKWIPPSKYIASQRAYKDSDENEPHMQFITASLDGYKILVWDLFIPDELKNNTYKKKFARLTSKPAALITDDSPLNYLKNHFKPVCQLLTKQLSYPITSILVQDQMYCYTARNSHTLDDIDQLTYFKVSEGLASFDYSTKLLFSTGVGTFQEASWEPYDFDPKYFAVDEKCQVERFADVHDGPILVCEVNPTLPNVILTVGGSVFAIWYLSKLKIPLFWRKNMERYITGMWSMVHPLSLLVVRNDTHNEVWNILERSDLPIQVYKYKGYKLTKLYIDTTRTHARKKTCVVTDTVGAFKLYTIPSESMVGDHKIDESLDYLDHLIKIKDNVAYVKQNFRDKQQVSVTIAPVEEKKEAVVEKLPMKAESEEILVNKEATLTPKMKWQLNREESMRKVLYEKKKINLSEIEKNRKVLQKIVSDNRAKANKVAKKKSERHAIFIKAKDHLINIETEKPWVQSTVKCNNQSIKDKYINDYNNMEDEVVKTIRKNHYVSGFNWPTLVMEHKQRYKMDQFKQFI